jgi:hypothetical protein
VTNGLRLARRAVHRNPVESGSAPDCDPGARSPVTDRLPVAVGRNEQNVRQEPDKDSERAANDL